MTHDWDCIWDQYLIGQCQRGLKMEKQRPLSKSNVLLLIFSRLATTKYAFAENLVITS